MAGGKLLRLLSQLRPRIRLLFTESGAPSSCQAFCYENVTEKEIEQKYVLLHCTALNP